MRKTLMILMVSGLAACNIAVENNPPVNTTPGSVAPVPPRVSRNAAVANFNTVVQRVEPVAERVCRERRPGLNCDFKIVVDNRKGLPPNAFQTVDKSGRPIIGFTLALIADARNRDELAFVMGHEAAHHISKHLVKQKQNAIGGAILGGLVAASMGVNVEAGQRLGGTVGARAYSKKNELEADSLGTVITHKAGYNPVKGAQFFARIPDPGDRFLGTHPPNAERLETVRRVSAQLR